MLMEKRHRAALKAGNANMDTTVSATAAAEGRAGSISLTKVCIFLQFITLVHTLSNVLN